MSMPFADTQIGIVMFKINNSVNPAPVVSDNRGGWPAGVAPMTEAVAQNICQTTPSIPNNLQIDFKLHN